MSKIPTVVLTATLILLALSSPLGAGEDPPEDAHGDPNALFSKMGQDKETDTIFKFEKKDRQNLLQLKGSGVSRSEGDEDTGSFGLEALYGHLFYRDGDNYNAYYFLSGKVASDNRQRFNATLGFFPPGIGGESKITYRLLHAELHDSLPISDDLASVLDTEYEQEALEQGFGFSYRKRFKIIIKELNIDYSYTHLGEEELSYDNLDINTPTVWRRIRADVGFGDVATHEFLVQAALGQDDIDNPFLKAIRLEVGSGYQEANYDGFRGGEDITDSGFSGFVEVKVCTPVGLFKTWYHDSQANEAVYGGYQLGGLDLYYKNIEYPYGQDEEVFGVALTFDLFDFSSSFDGDCPRFFYPSDEAYANVSQMRHIGRLAADEFTAKPLVTVAVTDLLYVDKTALPPNTRIDTSTDPTNPTLQVPTGCRQEGVQSVSPSSASNVFGVNGQTINITMTLLPQNQNQVTAVFDDACCGDTRVTVNTSGGATPNITGVNLQEEVGCVEEPTTATGDTQDAEEPQSQSQYTTPAQCLALGAVCDVNKDACCPGSSCQFAFNTGNGSVFLCQ